MTKVESNNTTKADNHLNHNHNCCRDHYDNSPKQRSLKKLIIKIAIPFLIIYVFMSVISGFFTSISHELDLQAESDRLISGSGEDSIALINIDGIILESNPGSSYLSVSDNIISARNFKKILLNIREDVSVKGLLIRVNSPGGSAAAAEEILREIRDFKTDTSLPVVFYFTDVAASGGYYISMEADKIIANPSSITGSIGVIISYLNVAQLAEEWGVKHIVYQSGVNKGIGDPFAEPTDDESILMQSLVDDAYDNFYQAVKLGRNLSDADLTKIADGRLISAKKANELGLIDEIGLFEDAVSMTKELAQIDEARVVEFGKSGFLQLLLGSINQKINLSLIENRSPTSKLPGTRLWYLSGF